MRFEGKGVTIGPRQSTSIAVTDISQRCTNWEKDRNNILKMTPAFEVFFQTWVYGRVVPQMEGLFQGTNEKSILLRIRASSEEVEGFLWRALGLYPQKFPIFQSFTYLWHSDFKHIFLPASHVWSTRPVGPKNALHFPCLLVYVFLLTYQCAP